jgi:hypothetical protein
MRPRESIPRSHWDRGIFDKNVYVRFRGIIETAESDSLHTICGIRTLHTIISIFSAKTKPYAKRLYAVNQGPRRDCLMKKTEGRKSRDTVPLKTTQMLILRRKKIWCVVGSVTNVMDNQRNIQSTPKLFFL